MIFDDKKQKAEDRFKQIYPTAEDYLYVVSKNSWIAGYEYALEDCEKERNTCRKDSTV